MTEFRPQIAFDQPRPLLEQWMCHGVSQGADLRSNRGAAHSRASQLPELTGVSPSPRTVSGSWSLSCAARVDPPGTEAPLRPRARVLILDGDCPILSSTDGHSLPLSKAPEMKHFRPAGLPCRAFSQSGRAATKVAISAVRLHRESATRDAFDTFQPASRRWRQLEIVRLHEMNQSDTTRFRCRAPVRKTG